MQKYILNHVNLPWGQKSFLLDTVMESVVDGKQISDSIWHTTKNIRLVNQSGDSVNLYDQQGKIIILDLF